MKRALDIICSFAGLILALPLLLVTTAVVRIYLGSPVLFTQNRLGKDGVVFKLYKFRTMRDAFDADHKPLPDSERLTRVGVLLRGASLDELPQLFNVLKGDMSLVGPRPLPELYRDRFSQEQWVRHQVRPGLTCLAQVMGRNALTWEDKFAWDAKYVRTASLGLDFRIILRTVCCLIRREGITHGNHATMPEFMGAGGIPVTHAKGANEI
ncbi:MAG: sugar transferase [Proteobacteria bacterium]|nr:sugar transferase [Pseudomonadota bacterium]MBU1451730.1 sugar transferase [Pseudomonadota bacterium]MBU2469266.1 sugar transferase [Pseudomonadota bacterium]MBU2517550.1 sugar transferase [Pseudomonadota bacterium]